MLRTLPERESEREGGRARARGRVASAARSRRRDGFGGSVSVSVALSPAAQRVCVVAGAIRATLDNERIHMCEKECITGEKRGGSQYVTV